MISGSKAFGWGTRAPAEWSVVNDMAGQLIPLPEFDLPTDKDLSMERRIAKWLYVMSCGRKMLEAGAKMREGPEVDLRAAYREQYQAWLDEHDQVLRRTFCNVTGGVDGS
jgi:hypothetical protein